MLPNTARISTDTGLLQLSDAPKHGRVYTGKSMAEYDLVSGLAQVVQVLALSNGQHVICAQTTPLLRYIDGRCLPTGAQQLAEGDVVCGSRAVPVHYPRPLECPEDAYWLGFFAGPGGSCPRRALEEFEAHCTSRQLQGAGLDAKIMALFEAYKVPWAFSLQGRAVPRVLWSASLADRQHYLRGLLASYGQREGHPATLSLPSFDFGQDLLLLLHTLGIHARLDDKSLWVPAEAPVGVLPSHILPLPGQGHFVGHTVVAATRRPLNAPITAVVLRGAAYGRTFDCSGIIICSHR